MFLIIKYMIDRRTTESLLMIFELDFGFVFLKDVRTHFGIDLGPLLL